MIGSSARGSICRRPTHDRRIGDIPLGRNDGEHVRHIPRPVTDGQAHHQTTGNHRAFGPSIPGRDGVVADHVGHLRLSLDRDQAAAGSAEVRDGLRGCGKGEGKACEDGAHGVSFRGHDRRLWRKLRGGFHRFLTCGVGAQIPVGHSCN